MPLLPAAPARAGGPGGDCGGDDTPPAFLLTPGVDCAGSFAGESYGTSHHGGGVDHVYSDRFEVAHTDGDEVTITLTGDAACVTTTPSAPLIARGDGRTTVDVRGIRTHDTAGVPEAPCPAAPGGYTIRADVVPNDRPAVTVDAPAGGESGEVVTITASGTDADGDLVALGLSSGDGVEWKDAPGPSAAWSTSFTHTVTRDVELTVYARDEHGAVMNAPSFALDMYQSECGGIDDADGEHVTLPVSCQPRMHGVEVDVFTFTVASGRRARVVTDYPEHWGYRASLTSPSGAVQDATDLPLFSTDEAGVWTYRIRGDGDTVDYRLGITEVGPPSPPVLVDVAAGSVAMKGDAFPVAMRAVDPNGETIRYTIGWDGVSYGGWPGDGRAASGTTVTGYRRFLGPETTSTAVVTATNEEGLSDSETFTVTIRPQDDCGFGADYDAPATASGADRRTLPAATSCTGFVGHLLPRWEPNPVDAADWYSSPHTCLIGETCKLRVTLTTTAGLSATVLIDNYVLGQHSSSCGSAGCTTTVETLGATYPHPEYPRIGVRRDAGKGEYTLRVEKVAVVRL